MCKISINAQDTGAISDWLNTRGGVAVWESINLSNPGARWFTPALERDGTPKKKPNWQSSDVPVEIVTDAEQICVYRSREVKRFHVATQLKGSGMVTLTPGATNRVNREVAKAGEGAYYAFDYATQEAVIFARDGNEVPLDDFMSPAS